MDIKLKRGLLDVCVLTVRMEDRKAWYERIGFNFHSPKITLYLPKDEYASLVIQAITGDIKITIK